MRLLIYGINYAPELTGIGKYTGEMAEWLAAKGHDVHVLTAMPYYPEWEVHDNYKGKVWYKEKINGVTIHRVPLYVPKNVSSIKRILHEFRFLLSSLPFWIKIFIYYQIRFGVCSFSTVSFRYTSCFYSKLTNTFLMNHIQDLQVDAAKDLGMIKNRSF